MKRVLYYSDANLFDLTYTMNSTMFSKDVSASISIPGTCVLYLNNYLTSNLW